MPSAPMTPRTDNEDIRIEVEEEDQAEKRSCSVSIRSTQASPCSSAEDAVVGDDCNITKDSSDDERQRSALEDEIQQLSIGSPASPGPDKTRAASLPQLTPRVSVESADDESSDEIHLQGTSDRGIGRARLFSVTPEPEPGLPTPVRDYVPTASTARDLVNATPSPSPAPTEVGNSHISNRNQSDVEQISEREHSCSAASDVGPITPASECNSSQQSHTSDASSDDRSEVSEDEEARERVPVFVGDQVSSLANLTDNLHELHLTRDGGLEGSDYSDFEDDMDDEDIHDVYDVKSETLPATPFTDARFQDALKKATETTNNIASVLSVCPLANQSGTDLSRLRECAEKLKHFDQPAERRISIIGDSGAGKSSLINSLLHEPDLAHRGDHGSAVTSWVTEYIAKKRHHVAPFTIRVQCSTIHHIKEQLDDLLYDFRAFHDPGRLDQVPEGSDDYRALQRKSEVALATIESLFPSRNEATAAWLLQTEVETIKSSLHTLADQISWPEGFVDGWWDATADSALECRHTMSQFMEKNLWPLIEKVEVYLSAQVLKTGIILADLPGLRDINLARVRKTERYQQTSDEIFIVADIKRVLSNDSVRPIIVSAGLTTPDPKTDISLICTHADDIDVASWEKDKSMKALADSQHTKRARREIYRSGKKDSAEALEIAKINYKYIWVEERNKRIRREVQKTYQTAIQQRSLHVFCLGNSDYQGSGYFYKASRRLAILKSGVPELRSFCHSIVSRAQFRAGRFFLDTEVPALIESIKVWMQAADQVTPLAIPPDEAQKLRAILSTTVQIAVQDTEQEFEAVILNRFQHHMHQYTSSARSASEDWERWPWQTYRAFVRQNGTHRTALVGYRCLNNEIIGQMKEDIQECWETLDERFLTQWTNTRMLLQASFQTLRQNLKNLAIPEALVKFVSLKGRELQARVMDETMGLFLTQFRIIRMNTCDGTLSNAYIAVNMLPTWRLCSAVAGSGTERRMKSIMRDKMDRADIFSYIYHQVWVDSRKVFHEVRTNIEDFINEICTDIDRQIQMTRGPESEASRISPFHLHVMGDAVQNADEQLASARSLARPATREAIKLGWAEA